MSYAPPSGGSLALEFIGAGYEPPHGAAVNLNFTPTVASGAPIFMSGVSGFAGMRGIPVAAVGDAGNRRSLPDGGKVSGSVLVVTGYRSTFPV